MYLTLNKIKPRTRSPLPTATLIENKWTWMLLELNKHNQSHSSPLAPDISIGFLDYYIHYFIWSPLRPCDIKPTALPSKYKKKTWRKARNKKAIMLGLLSGCKIRPGKCGPLNQMHKIGHLFSLSSDWTSGQSRRSGAHSHGSLHRWVPLGMWGSVRTEGQLPLKEARRIGQGCEKGRGHPRDGCYLSFAG